MKVDELLLERNLCKYCSAPAAKKITWADGRAEIIVCGKHEKAATDRIKSQDEEVDKVEDITESIVSGAKKLLAKYNKWKADRQEESTLQVWEDKTDKDIMVALKDAEDWLSLKSKANDTTDIVNRIQRDIKSRMRKYILPQMKKRGMQEPAVASTFHV